MVLQFLWGGWRAVLFKISGGGDGDQAHIRCDTHRNHILGDLFTQTNSGIKTAADDIGQGVIQGDLDIDIRVVRQKCLQHRPQHRVDGMFAGGDADVARRTCPHFTQGIQFTFNLGKTRTDAVEQSLTGFGRSHAAGGSGQ
ncbi:hypothetical protein D3C73_817640 [compost metagenome]